MNDIPLGSSVFVFFSQHCDKVIAEQYGISGKGQERTQVYAQIVGDRVTVRASEDTKGINFDRKPSQVSLEIHIHLLLLPIYFLL